MYTQFFTSLAIFCFLLAHTAAQLVGKGISVYLNGIDYYISPYTAGNVSFDASLLTSSTSIYGFVPVAVVQQEISITELPALVSNWTAKDDVFQPAFLQAVFIAGARSNRSTSPEGGSYTILSLDSSTIPSGPYFLELSTGSLYPVYRLYDDFSGSFSEALLQTPQGGFQPLSAQTATSATLTIGVPSRLYYTPSEDKPLAGVRVGVKDIFDLAGIKTSDGNRAWYSLYPAATITGTAMQRLIDAGAIIVGHQKPSQFANGEMATADWVDYHSPFNGRGDGYQDPSSSSSGAGASMGSYPWLDMAVGSDTGGSIRGPSQVNGLFGNRPSHGIVSLDHVMPLSTALDTAGFLLRDPALWNTAQAVLYGSNYTSLAVNTVRYPQKILTYNFPTNASASTGAALQINFANALAKFVSGNVSAINLTALWALSSPAAARNTSLPVFLNTTYPTLIAKEQTALVRDPFYRDYAAVHDGRRPFVDPAPLARWAYGDSVPASALQDAINNKTLFMNWFNTNILAPVSDPAQCSSALLLYLGSTGIQNTRNQYIPPPSVPFGFSAGRISVFTEVPDVVFPIGQAGSFSNVTQHVEYLPVSVDVLAAKGCDGLLVRLAQDLVAAGVLKIPVTGGTIYGGDILMKKRAEEMGIKHVRYVQ